MGVMGRREGGREGGRKRGREGGKEVGREAGRKEEVVKWREGRDGNATIEITLIEVYWHKNRMGCMRVCIPEVPRSLCPALAKLQHLVYCIS